MPIPVIASEPATRQKGDRVRVDINGTANVRLMTQQNFSSFKRGHRYRYYGGECRQTPVVLEVPTAGRWVVTVDTDNRSRVTATITWL